MEYVDWLRWCAPRAGLECCKWLWHLYRGRVQRKPGWLSMAAPACSYCQGVRTRGEVVG